MVQIEYPKYTYLMCDWDDKDIENLREFRRHHSIKIQEESDKKVRKYHNKMVKASTIVYDYLMGNKGHQFPSEFPTELEFYIHVACLNYMKDEV